MPRRFATPGPRRVRKIAKNGVNTTESPVMNAVFEALVSV
jgi:hypothetical protein